MVPNKFIYFQLPVLIYSLCLRLEYKVITNDVSTYINSLMRIAHIICNLILFLLYHLRECKNIDKVSYY
jgi:hypothetical protein